MGEEHDFNPQPDPPGATESAAEPHSGTDPSHGSAEPPDATDASHQAGAEPAGGTYPEFNPQPDPPG
jgi:hypothetical protein